MKKKPFNRRFSALTIMRIQMLSKHMELSDTAVVEQAIKEMAERKGIIITVEGEEEK